MLCVLIAIIVHLGEAATHLVDLLLDYLDCRLQDYQGVLALKSTIELQRQRHDGELRLVVALLNALLPENRITFFSARVKEGPEVLRCVVLKFGVDSVSLISVQNAQLTLKKVVVVVRGCFRGLLPCNLLFNYVQVI